MLLNMTAFISIYWSSQAALVNLTNRTQATMNTSLSTITRNSRICNRWAGVAPNLIQNLCSRWASPWNQTILGPDNLQVENDIFYTAYAACIATGL